MDIILMSSSLGAVDKLAALIAGPLTGAKMRLFQNTFTPTPASTEADFVANEATFGGYPATGIALTWSAVAQRAPGTAEAFSNRAFFQATDDVTPNLIGGLWIEKAAAGDVLDFVVFAEPVAMNKALQSISAVVDVAYNLPSVVTVET